MGEDTTFPASKKVQGQGASRRAYRAFIEDLKEFDWWRDYQELRALGWDWRKAVFIAWSASPVRDRRPETQEELATTVLGLASDRTIRKWRIKTPEIDDQIAQMQAAPLLKYRRDVYDALVVSASDSDHRHQPDRKLFFEMTGDYRRDQGYDPGGEPAAPEHIQQMIEKVYGDDDGDGD